MKKSIFLKLEHLFKRYKELEIILSKGYQSFDKNLFYKVSKEHALLSKLCHTFSDWKKLEKDIFDLKILMNDSSLKDLASKELQESILKQELLEKDLKKLLIPVDPNDVYGCFVEIRAATGGDEAAIFSGNLCKMYIRYAEYLKWKVDIISMHEGEKGGYKEIILKISGVGVCGRLKFESGGHRVQRVPETESQGRIHTSTCTVAVIPDLPKSEKIILKNSDLKIDTFRSSGAGGQHVNTTDSAVRITHIPTGCVVECQDERSQHKNREKAMSVLEAKIYTNILIQKNKENSLLRKNLLGTGERSSKNRTYNFPKNRVTDHRINLTVYCLTDILSGKLDILIDPAIQEYHANFLSDFS